jgi:hypothetical protein
VCPVPLGLHSYLQNGGRSRVEIKVEFHEGLYLFQRYVPLTDILSAFFTSQSDVGSYRSMLNFLYRSNGGNSDGNWVSEAILL